MNYKPLLKFFSHIIISIALLIATTGLTISKHYCGESLISVSVYSEAEFCCKDCDSCKNETVSIDPINDFVFSGSSFEFLENFDLNFVEFATVIATNKFNFDLTKNYSEFGFSPQKFTSIFSLFQVFRF